LPAATDGAGWRIIIAIQEERLNARVQEKLLEIQPHFDKTGKDTVERFTEWMESLIPSLKQERKQKDMELQRAMDALYKMGPSRIEPLRVPKWKTRAYAEDLLKKVP